jgi:hypothetical protein
MMKKIFLLLCFISAVRGVNAQTEYKSVMIIPFEPNMYFSDSDDQLAKYNKKNVKEIRTLFRYGLNINLNARILSQYGTVSLLSDSTTGASNDLAMIYKSISYFQDDVPVPPQSETSNSVAAKKGIFKISKESDAQTGTKALDNKIPKKYMNIRIVNKELLSYLAEKYHVDVFLFCNQFNLQTNYQHCLDRTTNTYQRDLWVHYSLFDKNGKQLAGGITQSHFPSNSNDMMEIMKTNFPALSEEMAAKLPGAPPIRSIKEN